MITIQKRGVVVLMAWCAAFAIGWYLERLQAQEKPAHQTRQWQITTLGSMPTGYVDVFAIDTEGVCLYVTSTGVITAVPKTQLPKGVGCQ